jgi:alpha-beta hydrolase superfamily lysophospholipase
MPLMSAKTVAPIQRTDPVPRCRIYAVCAASTGEPGEASLVPDALAVFDELQRLHPEQRIAVIGRSLGSGIASQVAARRPVERLALVTPFDSYGRGCESALPDLSGGLAAGRALRIGEGAACVSQADPDRAWRSRRNRTGAKHEASDRGVADIAANRPYRRCGSQRCVRVSGILCGDQAVSSERLAAASLRQR